MPVGVERRAEGVRTVKRALLASMLALVGCDDPAVPADAGPFDASRPPLLIQPPPPPSSSARANVAPAEVAGRLFARTSAVVVVAQPASSAMQIGMLSLGDAVAVTSPAAPKADCPGGFVGIAPSGFVCSGPAATLNGLDARVAVARAEGRSAATYPFAYGESLGAPLYVRVPSADEQARAEPAFEANRVVLTQARRSAMLGKEDEIPAYLRGVELTAPADPCPRVLTGRSDGEPPNALVRTLPVKVGVAWTSECEAEGRVWLVTPELGLVPRDRVARAPASTAHGEKAGGAGTIAFVTGKARPRYRMARYGYFEALAPLPPFTAVRLTGQSQSVGSSTYLETSVSGEYVLSDHVATVEKRPRPSDLGEHERWIDLDTRRSLLVAYEGDAIVYAALVASALAGEGAGRVPRGRFRIEWKHASRTLGEGFTERAHAPHVLVLAGGHTLYGDPWGPPLGINYGSATRLAPIDAAWLFGWVAPSLPEGWTSRRGTEAAPGTWVIVR
jgi:hypothetical protein